MPRNICTIFLTILIFMMYGHAYGQFRTLSPEQRMVLENELSKSGGTLTPEIINSLKKRPEFDGLSSEDIIAGKELFTGKSEPAAERVVEEEKLIIKTSEKTASLFDRYREIGKYQDISTDLKPFGYEFFSKTGRKLLMQRKDIPVSPDYIMGPGDEVKIMLWGRVNARYNLTIDRDGNITVPQIGPLQVNGMRFDEMKDYLTGQANQIIGAKINVTMGSMKSIQVFVLGDIKMPGSYAIGSFSTITGALLTAGGPSNIGSLRNIQLKRNNKTVVTMDFYDFLLKGDKSQDKVLQSGDVVFVHTAGSLVGIAGNVKRPAIYELREDKDLMSLFSMAGGVTPSAYTQQIQVERIMKNERQTVIDINDKDLVNARDFILQDGDLVKVFSIVDKDLNVVYIEGNIKRPGKYEYKPGMKIRDLINDTTDLLLEETYFKYALVKRFTRPGHEPQLITFHLGKLLFDNDEDNNIELRPGDSIYIYSKWLFKDRPSISVEGEVRKAGTFQLINNYRVRDAILEAGGLKKDASLERGEIFRIDEQGRITQLYFNVALAMSEDSQENTLLHDRDRVVIHSMWENRFKQTVSIDGDVKNPGEYTLTRNMKVKDLIFASGNVLESAYLDEVEISSQEIIDGKSANIEHRKVNLGKALAGDPDHNLALKPYDRIFVKQIPEWRKEQFVTLSGEFLFPGKYIFKKGERLSSIIERAGGYTDEAFLRGAVFKRESVRKLQEQGLQEMILRLEKELITEGSIEVSTALSEEAAGAKKVELDQKKLFIESLKKLKATGRMTVKLAHLRLLKGSQYDIELEDSDSLQIPMKSSVINVVGSVMSRGSYIYSEQMNYKDYVSMAGGFANYADEDNTYVLKVDGSARKVKHGLFSWNNSRSRWETSSFGKQINELEPGDTIVVPEKLERIAWIREIKDITQILMQMAVTAGVVLNLF